MRFKCLIILLAFGLLAGCGKKITREDFMSQLVDDTSAQDGTL